MSTGMATLIVCYVLTLKEPTRFVLWQKYIELWPWLYMESQSKVPVEPIRTLPLKSYNHYKAMVHIHNFTLALEKPLTSSVQIWIVKDKENLYVRPLLAQQKKSVILGS